MTKKSKGDMFVVSVSPPIPMPPPAVLPLPVTCLCDSAGLHDDIREVGFTVVMVIRLMELGSEATDAKDVLGWYSEGARVRVYVCVHLNGHPLQFM